MFHRLITLLPPVLAALIGASIAMAEDITISPNTGAVNVRSGPSIEYVVRVVLNNGYSLIATGKNDFDADRSCTGRSGSDNNMWLRVQFGEMEGWVARCAVQIEGDLDTLPIANPSHAEFIGEQRPLYETLTAENMNDEDAFTGFTSEDVVLRQEPDLGSKGLGTIPFLEEIVVSGRTMGGGWVQVQFGENQGWVARHLLTLPYNWMESVSVR